MPDFGLLPTGFVAKTLPEIQADLETGMISIFGVNVDVDPDSPDGQLLGLFAGALSEAWDTLQEVATIFDPQAASGVLQSRQVRLNGITRGTESFTLVTAEVDGSFGTILTAGAIAETSDTGDRFVLESLVVLIGTPVTSSWIAENPGAIPCEAATLTVITTPRAGWTSITNAAGATFVGALEEDDGDLRRRREVSTELGAVAAFTALDQAVKDVTGVTDSLLIVNETNGTVDTLPAKSYRHVVEGGGDDEIAQAIWDNGPLGIENSGAESGDAVDSNGNTKAQAFGRPVYIDIYITVDLTKTTSYPAGGDDLMEQAIIDYAAGILTNAQGFVIGDGGFPIGHDVEHSRLYEAVNTIPGHSVNSLLMDATNLPGSTALNIAITDLQKARFTLVNIEIT